MWNTEVVWSVRHASLRTPADGEYARVLIRMDGRYLQLWYRDEKLIDDLHCPWYRPLKEWRWAIGARAGQRADDHFVANLTMHSSHSAYDVGAVELRLSLNDQARSPPPFP